MEGAVGRLWRACFSRLSTWLQGYSDTTLSLTGILGLAAFLYGLYQYKLLRGSHKQQNNARPSDQPSTSAAAAAASMKTQHAQQRAQPAAPVSQGTAHPLSHRLGGAASLTISIPGVLLEERSPQALQECATVLPPAAAALRKLLGGPGRGPAVYLLAHVEDDIGEAVVRGALEHQGLLGGGAGQLPPHRLLFCGTLEGKVSLVRQIEPDLHLDAHPTTVHELLRFARRLVYVAGEKAPAVQGAPNLQLSPSLAAFLGEG